MARLREKWDAENLRLEATLTGGKAGPAAIKAARTRQRNAHFAYWEAARAAWADVEAGIPMQKAADKHGVLVTDIAEIAGG